MNFLLFILLNFINRKYIIILYIYDQGVKFFKLNNMGIREDKENELIGEISSMKEELVDKQVALIESFFTSGPANDA